MKTSSKLVSTLWQLTLVWLMSIAMFTAIHWWIGIGELFSVLPTLMLFVLVLSPIWARVGDTHTPAWLVYASYFVGVIVACSAFAIGEFVSITFFDTKTTQLLTPQMTVRYILTATLLGSCTIATVRYFDKRRKPKAD